MVSCGPAAVAQNWFAPGAGQASESALLASVTPVSAAFVKLGGSVMTSRSAPLSVGVTVISPYKPIAVAGAPPAIVLGLISAMSEPGAALSLFKLMTETSAGSMPL